MGNVPKKALHKKFVKVKIANELVVGPSSWGARKIQQKINYTIIVKTQLIIETEKAIDTWLKSCSKEF